MRRVLAIAIVVLLGVPAFAQPADIKDVDPQQQRRDKIKQRIRALRAYTLTEQLELDEATAAKLFPALAKYDDELDRLLAKRADIQRRLKSVGSGDAPMKSADIDKMIDEAVANQKAIRDTEAKRLEQLRKILTPAQVARTLIVLPQMERRIQNQLRKAVQRNRPGRRPPPATGSKHDEAWDSGELKNPYDAPRPPARTPRPPAKNQPCDPFGSMAGCRNK